MSLVVIISLLLIPCIQLVKVCCNSSFEALKMKLAAEGLFAQNLKKNLPHFNKAVGIITSSTGAALQDILHILARRDPSLKVVILSHCGSRQKRRQQKLCK